jgi:hypothetical protein
LYGCETLSLTLRKEHRLRVSENRVLRIFERNKEKVAGGGRRLHNEELPNLYASPNIIRIVKSRRIRGTGHVARMGAMKNTFQFLVWKPEGKKTKWNI